MKFYSLAVTLLSMMAFCGCQSENNQNAEPSMEREQRSYSLETDDRNVQENDNGSVNKGSQYHHGNQN